MANSTADLKRLLTNLQSLAKKPLDQATAMEPGVYTSEAFLDYERKKVFNKQWICIGRADAIAKPGDYLCHHIGDQPVVVIRQADGSVSGFANVCRHRMMTVLAGTGRCKRIVCPYHAWTYGLDGQLVAAPHMQERPKFDKSKLGLLPVRCELWRGWIYMTLNKRIQSVHRLLAELDQVVAPYGMEDYVQIVQEDHVWNTNWKQLTENFMEGYHLPVTHRATVGGYFPVEDTRFGNKSNPAFTYQTFTKTGDAPVGTAHKNNKRLKGDQRRTSILPTVFPSHMFMLAPDHLWYLSLQPKGVGQVHIRYGAAFAPEVLAASRNKDKLIADTRKFLDQVNAEDRFVVEGIHRGARAPLSKAGPLCWLERENHEFTQYLSRQLHK